MKKIVIIAIAVVAAMSCGRQGSESSSAVSFDEVLETRRSIRDFDASKEVTEAQVREILTAAQDAPSWTNSQPSRYYVAISPDAIAISSSLFRAGPFSWGINIAE